MRPALFTEKPPDPEITECTLNIQFHGIGNVMFHFLWIWETTYFTIGEIGASRAYRHPRCSRAGVLSILTRVASILCLAVWGWDARRSTRCPMYLLLRLLIFHLMCSYVEISTDMDYRQLNAGQLCARYVAQCGMISDLGISSLVHIMCTEIVMSQIINANFVCSHCMQSRNIIICAPTHLWL